MDPALRAHVGRPSTLSAQEADAITERNQRELPLLKLPGEIRNRIYELVFGGYQFHLRRDITSNKLAFDFDCFDLDDNHVDISIYTFLDMTTVSRQFRAETRSLVFSMPSWYVVHAKHYLHNILSREDCASIKRMRFIFFYYEFFEKIMECMRSYLDYYSGVTHVTVISADDDCAHITKGKDIRGIVQSILGTEVEVTLDGII
ncbi:hypothetical protein NX059_003715 [Plenodomus lindquistii]|nr:hypothetical protein NX059_003715 [Plenodomus lindquistii]